MVSSKVSPSIFIWILLLWVLLWSGIALWGTFSYCGRLVFPLDDTYIFLQYARTAAEGAPFQYQIGAPPSTGASSLPYTILLTVFALLSTGREYLVWVCFLLGVLTLFAIGYFMWKSMARVVGEIRARWMGIAAVSLGPVLWLMLSGMDGGLFILSLILALLAYIHWLRGGTSWQMWLVLGLVGWVRQEGMAVWGVMAILTVFWRRGLPRKPFHPLILLAPVLWAGQGLLYLSITGRFSPFSFISKSPWNKGLLLSDLLTNSLNFLIYTFKSVLFGMGGSESLLNANSATSVNLLLPPFALVLAVWGAVCHSRSHSGRLHPAMMALIWVAVLTIATALFTPSQHHWFRYLIPTFVLLIPGLVLGLEALANLTSRLVKKTFALAVWGMLFGGLIFAGQLLFVLMFGRNCRDIYAQHIAAADYLSKTNYTILTHDVGALGFYGSNKLVDVVGLITPDMAELKQLGKGAQLEVLYRMPPNARPQVFAGYPQGSNYSDAGFWHQKIWESMLTHLTIAGWNPFEIWTLDWSSWENKDKAISSTLYQLASSGNMVDEMDIGYVKSEKAHDFQQLVRDPELGWVRVARLNYPPGELGEGGFMDAGRLLADRTEFDLKAIPGRDHVLVLRTNEPFSVKVMVEGREVGVWKALELFDSSTFKDATFVIPASYCSSDRIHVSLLAADNGVDAPMAFHLFFITK